MGSGDDEVRWGEVGWGRRGGGGRGRGRRGVLGLGRGRRRCWGRRAVALAGVAPGSGGGWLSGPEGANGGLGAWEEERA